MAGRDFRPVSVAASGLPVIPAAVVLRRQEEDLRLSPFDEGDDGDGDGGVESWCGALLRVLRLCRLLAERLPEMLTLEMKVALHSSLSDLFTSGYEQAAHPPASLGGAGFVHQELRVLCEAAQLSRYLRDSQLTTIVRLPARLVAFLPGALQSGMESELTAALDSLLFAPEFLDSLLLMVAADADDDDDVGGSSLIAEARACLADARCGYAEVLAGIRRKSECWGALLPQDWIWLPVLIEEGDNGPEASCAIWAALLESRGLAPSPCPAARLARLLGTLSRALLSSAPSPAPSPLRSLVAACTGRPAFLRSLDLEAPSAAPGAAAFYDAWTEALRQYQGAGYGDCDFGLALLVPCGQRHHVKYRRALWSEMSACLRVMPIPVERLPAALLADLLGDGERSLQMLRLYAQELISGGVVAERSPVPYALAVHHLSAFMYQQADPTHDDFRQLLWSQALLLPQRRQQQLLRHLLLCDRCEAPLLRLHRWLPAGRARQLMKFAVGEQQLLTAKALVEELAERK